MEEWSYSRLIFLANTMSYGGGFSMVFIRLFDALSSLLSIAVIFILFCLLLDACSKKQPQRPLNYFYNFLMHTE